MGACDDLPAKPELLHWGTMRRARRDLVTRLCRASVNSVIKEHGVMCRLTATAFDENVGANRRVPPDRRDENDPSVRVGTYDGHASLVQDVIGRVNSICFIFYSLSIFSWQWQKYE
ncbi:hypothetical protein AVEN_190603-1 [Araneus ventricosus]|uniref:Uncharacterized protein n=1 Tax=Araneus ventricosus TaxID=182803 RepID=A0A4Y2CDZ3_ARAVE|nr:hypothetical protein AVEN_190603-1 [Araneus ventricosus]